MSPTSTPILERYHTARELLAALVPTVEELRTLSDADLLSLSQQHTDDTRLLGSAGAVIAGELQYRSRPELGGEGLARKTGHRTVINLLKNTTGGTKEQVLTTLTAGTLIVEAADDGKVDSVTGEVQEATQPWLCAVASAVAAGQISTAAASSITRGLGSPNSAITVEQLAGAAIELVEQALAGIDADRLFTNARDLRLELDLDGVKVREQELLALRKLTHFPLPNGMGRAVWDMDPISYAHFVALYDRATSPKRGGVRFVDPTQAEKAARIESDPRTPGQLAADTFLGLLKTGADTDSSAILGTGAPIIRITVAEKALQSGIGVARIDGQATPVSIDTVKELMPSGKIIRMGFRPDGTYVEDPCDPAIHRRFHTSTQREVLAVKFGGCMDPDCDRPPAWTEAHHIRHAKRDGGKTTVANGICLCKYHHLLYHNLGIEILQDPSGRYWKIPPVSIDPKQVPIRMPLKTRNLTDLRAADKRNAS